MVKAGESQDSTLFFLQERQSMPALTNTYTAVWRKRDASLEKEHFLSIFCPKVGMEYRNCVQPKTRPPTDGPNKCVTLDSSVGRSPKYTTNPFIYWFQDCREIKARLMAVSHETFRHGRNALVVFHVFFAIKVKTSCTQIWAKIRRKWTKFPSINGPHENSHSHVLVIRGQLIVFHQVTNLARTFLL